MSKILKEYRGMKIGDTFTVVRKPRYWNSLDGNSRNGIKKVEYPYVGEIAYIVDREGAVGFKCQNGYGWAGSSGLKNGDIKEGGISHRVASLAKTLAMPTIREFPDEQPNVVRKAKVGEWIKFTSERPEEWVKSGGMDHYLGTIVKVTKSDSTNVGFEGSHWAFLHGQYFIATEAEVEKHFVKLAKSKGFGVGVGFESIIKKDKRVNYIRTALVNFRFRTDKGNEDSFHMGEYCVSVNGNWAKPLNDPEININYKFLRNEVQSTIKERRHESEGFENQSRRESVTFTSAKRLVGNVTRIGGSKRTLRIAKG